MAKWEWRQALPAWGGAGLLRGLSVLNESLGSLGAGAPWIMAALFLGASWLMIWRLESLCRRGFEGTVIGTLVMPYCSGIGNLIFVFVVGSDEAAGREVVVNCLVNNVTNLTLLLGLPALIWGLRLAPEARRKARKKDVQAMKLGRLSLLLSMLAVFFFTGATWALARDGKLDRGDGLVLVGIFVFWQSFHVYEVLKGNVQTGRSFHPIIVIDSVLILAGAIGIYVSLDWIVNWLSGIESGFISRENLGWLTGWLMVLPNAMLAFYYAWKRRAEIVYSSQLGDGHICIPLCVGLFAILNPMTLPGFFELGIVIVGVATILHAGCVVVFGGLPRWLGAALVVAYGWFVYRGLG